MKMLSLNVRGLGDQAKRRKIRSLVLSGKFDCCFFQESKCFAVNNSLIERLWGGVDCEWIAKSSVGLSGGLISIWRAGSLSINFYFSGDGFLGVCGVLEKTQTVVYLVNVYSPCHLAGKRKLWEELTMSKRGFPKGEWCIAGDFNAVMPAQERKCVSGVASTREHEEFSSFIQSLHVLDVPLLGKKFS